MLLPFQAAAVAALSRTKTTESTMTTTTMPAEVETRRMAKMVCGPRHAIYVHAYKTAGRRGEKRKHVCKDALS
jgi:hypothetical protein